MFRLLFFSRQRRYSWTKRNETFADVRHVSARKNLSNVTEYGHLAANGKIDPLDLTKKPIWIRPQTTWLPKLPVPKLQETAIQYLEAVRVVADDDQYLRTKELVQDFTQPHGLGPKLQQILVDKQQKDENWVIHLISLRFAIK